MLLRGLPLLAIALAAPICGGEDPVAVLEKQKQELLASTVEKKEFWAQVERKGAAAKKLRVVEEELSALQAELGVQDARRAAMDAPLAEARDVNARAEAVKAEIEQREAELAAAIRALEEKLAAWQRARAEGSG